MILPSGETVDIDEIRWRLDGWVNAVAARYGHPVWLVGSALSSNEPGDIDVRVILPDDEFAARWGPWRYKHAPSMKEGEGGRRWAGEMAKQSRWIAKNCRLHVDFQVVAEWECREHADCPKVRLDVVDFDAASP